MAMTDDEPSEAARVVLSNQLGDHLSENSGGFEDRGQVFFNDQ